jgi:hypothetical protein
MMSPADQIAQLEYVVREQMTEIDRQRTLVGQKNAEIDTLVAWIAGEGDALGALQSVYVDPRVSTANKVKAAVGAIGYERSKPASVIITADWTARTRDARLAQLELDRAEWSRQQQLPILASDHEGDSLEPDSAD